jgi:hypothetical protein
MATIKGWHRSGVKGKKPANQKYEIAKKTMHGETVKAGAGLLNP